METKIFRVVKQGQPVQVVSKQGDRQLWKCPITLREMGGLQADEYAATMLDGNPQGRFRDMELVVAKLRFTTREYEGRVYQDVTVKDIVKFYGQTPF